MSCPTIGYVDSGRAESTPFCLRTTKAPYSSEWACPSSIRWRTAPAPERTLFRRAAVSPCPRRQKPTAALAGPTKRRVRKRTSGANAVAATRCVIQRNRPIRDPVQLLSELHASIVSAAELAGHRRAPWCARSVLRRPANSPTPATSGFGACLPWRSTMPVDLDSHPSGKRYLVRERGRKAKQT